MNRHVSPSSVAREATAPVGPGSRLIHVIDDDAMLGAALTAGLEAHGYRTTFSSAADTGWTAAHQLPPDLILCDINMPRKNGHWLLQELRKDGQLGNCPFVFMTGNPMYAQPRTGMDLGADDFLLKPFTIETLVSCVAARLRRQELVRQGENELVNHLRESLRRGLPHEFFTPLTGIIGYAELLQEDGDTLSAEAQREAVDSILRSGLRLRRTLRNYLYTLDRLTPDSATPFPVLSAQAVAQLIQQGTSIAVERHRRRADLAIKIEGETLESGSHDLSLVVEELVDNACSFSRAGTPITVRARRAGPMYEITVSDEGRGMTHAQIRELGRFRQFERSKHEQQGLGLGVFLVQQAARRLGGKLEYESGRGTGTTARVWLPLPPAPQG